MVYSMLSRTHLSVTWNQSFEDSGGKNEATTVEVERVLDILQKLYKETDGKTL
jgi:hypothetical protein